MPVISKILNECEIKGDSVSYLLRLRQESKRTTYPGMHLYILELFLNGITLADFRTNTYEYTAGMNLDAESVSVQRFEKWREELLKNPSEFTEYQRKLRENREKLYPVKFPQYTDAVIIQGSPRPDGNSSAFALWAKEKINSLNKTVSVIYPHDMALHPCIGCYQCYNYGRCVLRDDMDEIVSLVSHSSLVVICTPVYTGSVPAALKSIFDRFQSYHGFCSLHECNNHPKGILFASAGRKGLFNFDSLQNVCNAFMDNCGIVKSGSILCDNSDEIGDIRRIKSLRKRADDIIEKSL